MMQTETDAALADRNATRTQSLDWRPVSLWALLGRADATSVVTLFVWFAFIGVCIWFGISTAPPWSQLQFHLFGLPLRFVFYFPWVGCVLLVTWMGLEWAVVPAYLGTLFGTLSGGVPLDISLVNALHAPFGLTLYYLAYSAAPKAYALRTLKAWLVFACGSFLAALTSTFGAFIWQLNVEPTASALLSGWATWGISAWLTSFGLSLVLAGVLIYLLSPVIERAKQRYIVYAGRPQSSWRRLLVSVSMFALLLVLFMLANQHWQNVRIQNLVAGPLPEVWRHELADQFDVQRLIIWTLGLLLVVLSLGGAMAGGYAMYLIRRRTSTEVRQAHHRLERSEARFRHFFENNPAPMWVYDPRDGCFLEVNAAAVRQYGYTRDEFLSMTIFDIRPPQEAERLRKIPAIQAPGRNWDAGEWQHHHKDGTPLDVEVHVSYLHLEGRVVHLALMHDISLRRKAQVLMEQRAHELNVVAAASLELTGAKSMGEVMQISTERVRQLVGANIALLRCRWNTPDAGIDRHVSLAPSYSQALGDARLFNDDELFAHLAAKCPIFLTRNEFKQHPWFHEALRSVPGQLPLNGLLAVPITSGGSTIGMLAVLDKIGSEFDVQDQALLAQLAQITAVSIENLRLNQALHIHMQELERRVAERTAELDSSNRELDAFAYSVAHDLRAPLRAMHGFANALQEDYGATMDDAGRNYLTRIVGAAHNMDLLIQDLLAYSRIGRVHMALEGVPLNEVVQDALTDLAAELQASHAKISVDVAPGLMVQAHRATLKQVILNLVSNAIKFMAAGRRPEPSIRAYADNGWVKLAVADNGIGIAPEHYERIFNVFERLHGAESYPGTGVGLSIVKKGLARMHGEIGVESSPDGSIFTATLKEFERDK